MCPPCLAFDADAVFDKSTEIDDPKNVSYPVAGVAISMGEGGPKHVDERREALVAHRARRERDC